MSELELIEMLADRSLKRKVAARQFLKSAGLGDLVGQFAKKNKPELLAAGAGAAVGTLGQYMANRPRGDEPSIQQVVSDRNLAKILAQKAQAKKEKRPLTFSEELSQASAPAEVGIADALAKHPVKGALLAAPIGAAVGLSGLQLLRALK